MASGDPQKLSADFAKKREYGPSSLKNEVGSDGKNERRAEKHSGEMGRV